MIDFAAVTDAGRVRSENQDRWFADAELGLFVVADGLGGHAAGALAAQLAVDILPRLVRRTLSALTPGPSPEYGRGETEILTAGPSPRAPCTHGRGRGEKSALTPGPSAEYGRGETSALTPGPSPRGRGKLGHDRLETYPTAGELCSAIAEQVKVLSDLVYNETHGQPGVNGTGTTLALALVDSAQATIVHAGDSRVYLLRQGQLRQVTEDHTLGQLLVRNHELSESAVKQHPAARRLTRYIGMPTALTPDSQRIAFGVGDLLLLCSDGLHGQLDDGAISTILQSGKTIKEIGHELVAASNRAGGGDNVTVLLISPAE